MTKPYKILTASFLIILMLLAFSPCCFANSAEPPSIVIIAANTTDDVEIGIYADNTYLKASTREKGIEKYYIFYSGDLRTAANYNLKVKTNESVFEVPINAPIKTYNNFFTLDLKNRTLVPGKLLSRSLFLVALRLTMTIAIEGLIFYLMGYRGKRSWIAFFAINMITQGALNIWLNSFSPLAGYVIVSLIFGEFFVFILEIITFLVFLREHRWWRTLLFVILANMLSLLAGGYAISILPI